MGPMPAPRVCTGTGVGGGHGGGDSGEDEEEGEDQLPQHGADAAGVDDGDFTLVERIRVLGGGHGGTELHHTRRSCSWDGRKEGRGVKAQDDAKAHRKVGL